APRPHNSGHYSYDACVTSQFEQHLRALCGLPLGSPRLLTPAVMVNILGEDTGWLFDAMRAYSSNVKGHLYGKEESRPGRKMGHVTVFAPDVNQALDTVKQWKKTAEIGQRG